MANAAFVLSFSAYPHPGVIATGCQTVLINTLPAARLGDDYFCLMPPVAGPHPPNKMIKGSSTVLIGGKPAARVGDLSGCGAVIASGSPNVLIGE